MKDWLSGLLGENTVNVGGFILILALIICGIFVVLAFIRRIGGGSFTVGGRNASLPRLSVMDAAPVDAKRKLVLIRRDDVEHLLLIGGPTDLVVEQNINREPRGEQKKSPSRIEPNDVERFRQRETTLGTNVDSTIQLNSAIKHSEPAAPMLSRQDEETIPSQPTSQSSVTPVTQQPEKRETQARKTPAAPRPAPPYPPQPRQVLPAQTPDPQPSARLHPAYPLSQVSRGVLASTSGAATSSSASVDLGKVNPSEEAVAPKSVRTNVSEPAVQNKVNSEPELPSNGLRFLAGVSSSDLDVDNSVPRVTGSSLAKSEEKAELFDAKDFETELLGSLDISPIEPKSEHSIEDEMEKLLGDLSEEHNRKA